MAGRAVEETEAGTPHDGDFIDLMARHMGYSSQERLPAGTTAMLLTKDDGFIYGEITLPDGTRFEMKSDKLQ